MNQLTIFLITAVAFSSTVHADNYLVTLNVQLCFPDTQNQTVAGGVLIDLSDVSFRPLPEKFESSLFLANVQRNVCISLIPNNNLLPLLPSPISNDPIQKTDLPSILKITLNPINPFQMTLPTEVDFTHAIVTKTSFQFGQGLFGLVPRMLDNQTAVYVPDDGVLKVGQQTELKKKTDGEKSPAAE